VASESTAVTAAKATVASATNVTTAVLCPQWYRQTERERRDGNQATHTDCTRL